MSQTITMPDLWLLVAPCGCLDGWLCTTHMGRVTRPNEEVAWKDFEPTKRTRDRMQSKGWVVRGGDYAEWNDSPKSACPHVPQYVAPVTSVKGQTK